MINPATEIIEVEQTATAKAVYRDLAEQTDTLAPAMRRSLSILFGPRFRYPTPKALIEDSTNLGCAHRLKKPKYKHVCDQFCRQKNPLYLSRSAQKTAGLIEELSCNKELLETQRQDYRQLADAWDSTVAASILLFKHSTQLVKLREAARETGRTEKVAQVQKRIVEIDTSVAQLHIVTAPALLDHIRKAKAEIDYQTLAAELDMQASNPIVDALHQQVDDAIKSIAALPALTKPD